MDEGIDSTGFRQTALLSAHGVVEHRIVHGNLNFSSRATSIYAALGMAYLLKKASASQAIFVSSQTFRICLESRFF